MKKARPFCERTAGRKPPPARCGPADEVAFGGDGHDTYYWGLTKDGKPIQITDDMWNSKGHLILPPGSSGEITGTNGEILTFSDVEIIRGMK